MKQLAQYVSCCLHGVDKTRTTAVFSIFSSPAFLGRETYITGPVMSKAVVSSQRFLMVSNNCFFQRRFCGTLAHTVDKEKEEGLLQSQPGSTTNVNHVNIHEVVEDSNKNYKNNNNNNNNNDVDAVKSHESRQEPKELLFYDDFLLDEEDVHYLLLQEAHVKHGVLLNVPPQLSPSGTPPEVPEVILPPAHLARMRGVQLAYEPTHMPPPLYTTGTRQLIIENRTTLSPTAAKVQVTSVERSTSTAAGAVKREEKAAGKVLLRRLPPDPSMRFHCSVCGKAFRLEVSAEQHVKLKHTSDVHATVAAGPGEGEIIEETEVTVTTSTHGTGAVINNIPTIAATAKAEATTTTRTTTTAAAVLDLENKETSNKADTALAAEAATDLKTKGAGSQQEEQHTTSGETNIGKRTTKAQVSKATLTLPSEELVEELLRDVWDDVAAHRDDVPKKSHPEAYVSFASVVEGKADRRKEMEASAKPTARATPEGAAPGIKTGMSPGGGMPVSKARAQAKMLPIKELIKKYPNPFGDSPNAALQELEKEPLNPFIPQEELAAQLQVAREDNFFADSNTTVDEAVRCDDKNAAALDELKARLRASRPSLKRSASLRRFTCPLCVERVKRQEKEKNSEVAVPSFRLLDALFDHVETAHEEEELTEEQLSELYSIQRHSALHNTNYFVSNNNNNSGTSGTGDADGDDNSDEKSNDNQTPVDAVKAASLPELLQSAAPPAAVEQKSLSVHVRSGSNAVLLGRIADVQHGFLGTMAVTQYVLEVAGDDATRCEEGTEEKGVEKELVVIRCMGDNFPVALLKEQVKLGSTVLVQGTLRMNRHIDNTSRRLHAYPFVQVVPPLGCVKVLG